MKITGFVTAALAAALLLSGCAPATDAPAPTAIPAPATELNPLDLDGNGSVSEREKEIAAKNAVRDYTLPDGNVVAVDPTQPLPEPVKAAVKAETAGPVARGTILGQEQIDSFQDLTAVLDAEAARTGRGIIVVYQAVSAGEGLIWVPAVSGLTQAPFFGSADKAAIVDHAQSWAESRGYELIVY